MRNKLRQIAIETKKMIRIILTAVFQIIFKIIPIKKNKIIMWSYTFKEYSCNPKYLTEYIISKNDNFDIVWVFNKKMQLPDDFSEEIRIIRFFSLRYLYEISTAKIIITNARINKNNFIFKRAKQYYIQTWHGTIPFKKVEKDALDNLSEYYKKSILKDSKKCDLITSGCKSSSDVYRNSFYYNGEILECGTPRIDFLFRENSHINKKVRDYYNIDKDKKILLYAPTFRNGHALNIYDIDYKILLKVLKSTYNTDWVILFRLHPNMKEESNKLDEFSNGINYINASLYNDIQDLLIASDILITDFSSCMFDFLYLKKPCFLYASDYDDYINNNRGLYLDIKELPFDFAQNNNELVKNITNFKYNTYSDNSNAFLEKIGNFENGTACESIFNHIKEIL